MNYSHLTNCITDVNCTINQSNTGKQVQGRDNWFWSHFLLAECRLKQCSFTLRYTCHDHCFQFDTCANISFVSFCLAKEFGGAESEMFCFENQNNSVLWNSLRKEIKQSNSQSDFKMK